jgi:hypothetical protein
VKEKEVGGMAQVVEYLPGKQKALSSNSGTEKREGRERVREKEERERKLRAEDMGQW